MRLLLIDKILEYEKGESVTGVKEVALSEDYFTDHFPRFPVMPGALQLEAIVQLVSWLVFVTKDFSVKTRVKEVSGVKFSGFVRPGDKMVIKVNISSIDENGAEFSAKVLVDDKTRTSVKAGSLSFVDIAELEDPEEAKTFFNMLTERTE